MVRFVVVAAALLASRAAAEDWPQFRGPDGQGHSSETQLPLHWSEQENVAWRTSIPGAGWSSPVVAGDQVWLTTALEETGTLKALCLDRRTGRLLHDVVVFQSDDLGRIAAENTHASPTPVIDGPHVYVHFGSQGTACVHRDGAVVWTRQLAYDQHHGPGSSPVVWGQLVILACDGLTEQYLAALDKLTGRLVWRRAREAQQGYSTPLVVRAAGREQLISATGEGVAAFSPWDGAELWRFRFDGHSVVPRPVVAADRVYVCSGYWTPRMYAVALDGRGDVTNSHGAGAWRRGIPLVPSPLVVGSRMYLISDQGVLTVLDLASGRELWRQRMEGNFSASPLEAEGRIYLTNEDGETTVIADAEQYTPLAVNRLPGRTLASLAVSNGSLFLRTDRELFCIGPPRPYGAPPASGAPQTARRPAPAN